MKPNRNFPPFAATTVAVTVSLLTSAFAADVTFSTFIATNSADTSWVLTHPAVASINFGGNDVSSFGLVPWEGTRTNGHNPNETYAAVGGYTVYFSQPGVAWGNATQNTFYPTDASASVLHDAAWLPGVGQIDIVGLKVGREYTAKFIIADSRGSSAGRQVTVSAMGANTGSSGTVQYAYTDGQYLVVTATWTADATSISFNPEVAGGVGTQINAIQVMQNPLPPGSDLTWDNGASTGVWNTADLNWTGSAWTNATTNNAVFGATGAGAVTVGEPVTVGNLTFNAAGYSISGSSLSLESSTIATAHPVTIASNLTGSGLIKAGTGELTLNGSLAYTGGTTVSAGSLVVGTGAGFSALNLDSGTTVTAAANDAALTVSGNLTLHDGATLAATGSPNGIFGNIYLPDLGQQVLVTGNATSTISARIHLREIRTFDVADGAAETDLLISGRVDHIPGQAWAALAKSGDGTLRLTAGNGHGGNFLNAGTLVFANDSLGNPGGPWPLAQFNGNATLRWDAGNTQDISTGGELAIADGVVATLDTNGNDVILGSPISVGGSASGNLVKAGAGTLTLAAANNYIGNTYVDEGTLILPAGSQLAFKVSDGAANFVSGSATAVFDGNFNINTAAVSGTAGGIWLLVDRANLTGEIFDANFAVSGFDDGDDDGIWTMTDAKGNWSFDESTGELMLDIGNDYDSWGAPYGLAVGSEDGDLDGDGLTNQQEYAFGLIPNSGASVNAITNPLDKSTGKFSYTRRATPTTTGLTYTIWISEDLATWTEDSGATISQAVTGTVGEVETVEVTISGSLPLSPSRLFIQVRAE